MSRINQVDIMLKTVLSFLATLVLLQTSCLLTSERRLIIKDGYYSLVETPGDEIKVNIQFKYQVEGTYCRIGGYDIDWGSHRGRESWYSMQELQPGVTYKLTRVFQFSDNLTTDPWIGMQGYVDPLSRDPGLKAEYKLKRTSRLLLPPSEE